MYVVKREPDKAYLDSLLWIPKTAVNCEGVQRALTFHFVEDKEVRSLALYYETEHHLLVPREFWKYQDVPFEIVDCRPQGFTSTNLKSKIVLDAQKPGSTVQKDALNTLLSSRGGILQLACGKGKTVVALELIARMGVPAIVILDTTQLLTQWRGEILRHLDIQPDQIGLIQEKTLDWKKPIVLATYHTLANRAAELPEEVRRWFGVSIWDEGHHIAATTFSRTADLFYGYRLALTATPNREDGLNIVYDLHIGDVLFKDLTQDLKPKIYFKWTGMQVDLNDPAVKAAVCDINDELHIGKIASHFGKWRARLDLIIAEVHRLRAQDRKVLVLSNSIDELVNLLCVYKGLPLYTDVAIPSAQEVNESVSPIALLPKTRKQMETRLHRYKGMLQDPTLNAPKRHELEQLVVPQIEMSLRQDDVWKKIEKEHLKRQRAYLKKVLEAPGDAGLMIHRVEAEERMKMLREKNVTFAIMKYGKEGLDDKHLDTVIACEPMSSRNVLQQFMGRVLRAKPGKKQPVVIFMEDDVPPMTAMCRIIRRHLRTWPVEESGPYDFELVGHPRNGRR